MLGGTTPEVVRDEEDAVRMLEMRLHIHGEYTELLHGLMQACEDPPSDAALLDLLERSLETAVAVTDSEQGTLMLRDNTSKSLVLVLQHGGEGGALERWSPVPREEGLAHWVVEHGCGAVVNNAASDGRCGRNLSPATGTPIRSALAVPLWARGQFLGVVEVLNKRHGALYALRDRKRLELICHFDGRLLDDMVNRASQPGPP